MFREPIFPLEIEAANHHRPEHYTPGVLQGHTVMFTTAGKLLGELASLDSDSVLRARLHHYARPELLVIDEVGYLAYSSRYADSPTPTTGAPDGPGPCRWQSQHRKPPPDLRGFRPPSTRLNRPH